MRLDLMNENGAIVVSLSHRNLCALEHKLQLAGSARRH
jgi:hypothetical protein